jgi:hypothetical protein
VDFLGHKEGVTLVPKFHVVLLHVYPYVPTALTSKFPPIRGPDKRVLKPTTHLHLEVDLGIFGSELLISNFLIVAVLNYSPQPFDIYFYAL